MVRSSGPEKVVMATAMGGGEPKMLAMPMAILGGCEDSGKDAEQNHLHFHIYGKYKGNVVPYMVYIYIW